MNRRLDRLLVVDLESTCWAKAPPPGEESEIIEVGVVELACVFPARGGSAISAPSTIMVRPTLSSVSEFCTTLTTITPEEAARGGSFADACALLAARGVSAYPWASWGNYDRVMFERQCARLGVPYPFGPTHLNLKTLWALATNQRRERSMAYALNQEGLPLLGTHHRAADDAFNIARIGEKLLARLRASSPAP